MDTEQYLASRKIESNRYGNRGGVDPEEWLADICFGAACFCGAFAASLTIHDMPIYFGIPGALSTFVFSQSRMLRNGAIGVLLSIAALYLIKFAV